MSRPQAAARGIRAAAPSGAEVAGLAAATLAPPLPVPLVAARPPPSPAASRSPPLAPPIARCPPSRPVSRLRLQARGRRRRLGLRRRFGALTAQAAPQARPKAAPAARQCQTVFGRSRYTRRRNSSLHRRVWAARSVSPQRAAKLCEPGESSPARLPQPPRSAAKAGSGSRPIPSRVRRKSAQCRAKAWEKSRRPR